MAGVLGLLAAALVVALGVSQAGAVLLGVLGWLVALAARLPVLASAGRLHDARRRETILAAASGTTDEVVRLALVVAVVGGFGPALWAGFGWALAELVFLAATQLTRFGWPIGERAVEQLKAQGGFVGTHPVHSGVRGVAATSFSIGATLLLVAGPWWVVATAFVHAAVNVAFARWAGRRLVSVELFGAVVGVGLVVAGLFGTGLS
ncbi:hypothetical protein ACIA8G_12700 [Lentzea sp. NPDC051213]|uniref:hypothetical protein n=1 Tax=Lentzea sp. NPDC051213 TaxID=3364126 RepID=UPI0037B40AE0